MKYSLGIISILLTISSCTKKQSAEREGEDSLKQTAQAGPNKYSDLQSADDANATDTAAFVIPGVTQHYVGYISGNGGGGKDQITIGSIWTKGPWIQGVIGRHRNSTSTSDLFGSYNDTTKVYKMYSDTSNNAQTEYIEGTINNNQFVGRWRRGSGRPVSFSLKGDRENNFSFKVRYTPMSIREIEVYRGQTRIQDLKFTPSVPTSTMVEGSPWLELEDFNSDGYLDLAIHTQGATGGDNYFHVYHFLPKEDRFNEKESITILNPEVDVLIGRLIDTGSKMGTASTNDVYIIQDDHYFLTESSSEDAGGSETIFYSVENGKSTPIRRENKYSDGSAKDSVFTFQNGKWVPQMKK